MIGGCVIAWALRRLGKPEETLEKEGGGGGGGGASSHAKTFGYRCRPIFGILRAYASTGFLKTSSALVLRTTKCKKKLVTSEARRASAEP